MSIFSPCSSAVTARTREPTGPMQAPLALSPATVRPHGDLGPVPGLAGERGDLDRAVGDLRHLEGEQPADQVGVGARHGDRGAALPAADGHDAALQPAAVRVDLARAPARSAAAPPRARCRRRRAGRARCGSAAPRAAAAACCTMPADDVALAAGVLAVGQRALGLAQPLEDDLLGGARRDAAEARGGVVVLAQRRCRPRRAPGRARRPRRCARSSSTRACGWAPSVCR